MDLNHFGYHIRQRSCFAVCLFLALAIVHLRQVVAILLFNMSSLHLGIFGINTHYLFVFTIFNDSYG